MEENTTYEEDGVDDKSGANSKCLQNDPNKQIQNDANWKVCKFTDLPPWLQDNSHIVSGYRPQLPSYKLCAKSIFRIHTETGNILTHLIGFLAFIGITIAFYSKPFCKMCHLQIEVGKFWQKLDYTGIVLLIVGSFVPAIYYAFYCLSTVRTIYITIISVLGLGTMVVIMVDRFGTPEYRKVRAVLFVCLGGFGFIPGIHCIIISGWDMAVQKMRIDLIFGVAFQYIFGAFLYGMRIPERIFPGKCDLLFQSHQIFHILVLSAALLHYVAIAKIAQFRMTQEGQCE